MNGQSPIRTERRQAASKPVAFNASPSSVGYTSRDRPTNVEYPYFPPSFLQDLREELPFDPLARPGRVPQKREAGLHGWVVEETADRNAPPHLGPPIPLDQLTDDSLQREAVQWVAGMGDGCSGMAIHWEIRLRKAYCQRGGMDWENLSRQLGLLLARGKRTRRRCSFDARSRRKPTRHS